MSDDLNVVPDRNLPVEPPKCEHYWASVHEPGHTIYWIRQCMLCHRVDWNHLDEEIQTAVALANREPLPTATDPPETA